MTCGSAGQTAVFTPALEAAKENWGFYVQDSFKPRPNLTFNVGLRLDREEATTDGFTPFNPQEEAAEFLDLLFKASGRTFEDVFIDIPSGDERTFGEIYADELTKPKIQFDLNGDGRDPGHCGGLFGLDRVNNSLVTGFTITD